MKKAKFLLTSLILIAVVGGAMAFKVKNKALANVYCRLNIGTEFETCQQVNYTTHDNGAATTNDPCPEEPYFYTRNSCVIWYVEWYNTVYETDL